MSVVKSLTPSGTIHGTDLGIPVMLRTGEESYIFGDTFATSDGQARGPRHNGGPTPWTLTDWRSPVVALTNQPLSNPDPALPIDITWRPHGGAQLWPYPHNSPEYTTVLPCDGMVVNGRFVLWVMVTQGLGNERWMEIWTSEPGRNIEGPWVNRTKYTSAGVGASSQWSAAFDHGRRRMLTWDRARDGSPWTYWVTTGGLQRSSGLRMYRAHRDWFDPSVPWSYDANTIDAWRYTGGRWQWGKGVAHEILPPGNNHHNNGGFGEVCLRWIQGHWVLSGFEAWTYRMFVKIGGPDIEQINWATAPTYYPVRGNVQPWPLGSYDIIPNLYGCYISSLSRFRNPNGSRGTFRAIVSSWLPDGSDYSAKQVTFSAPDPVAAVVHDDPNPSTRTDW